MGMFDTIDLLGDQVQVKCWDRTLKVYRKGDRVPEVAGLDRYSILLPDESYIWIRDGKVYHHHESHPGGTQLVINKWGDVLVHNKEMVPVEPENALQAELDRQNNKIPAGANRAKSPERRFVTDTGHVLTQVHEETRECSIYHCPIHNPSSHARSIGESHWNGARNRMERVCKHGVGHPDPDSQGWRERNYGDRDMKHDCCEGRCCEVQLPGPSEEEAA